MDFRRVIGSRQGQNLLFRNLFHTLNTCGELCVAMQSRYLEILDFTQFFDHFVFTPNAENVLEKELKKEIPVSVGIELVVVDMSRNG